MLVSLPANVQVRVVCRQCRRPVEEFGYDGHTLYPVRPAQLVPAGLTGRREEFRWRLRCEEARCALYHRPRVVNGVTIRDRTEAALASGRSVEQTLTGNRKRAAREAIEAGLLGSWEEARQGCGRLVVLVLGTDL